MATQVIAQWSRYTQNQFKARVHATWKPLKTAFVKWWKRYYLKLKELEIRYRPARMWVDKHTMLEQFFSLGFEYYDTKYDIPRARLEYHFQRRNYQRSVKTMFEHWAHYTSMEDIDANRTWVVHGYERLKKTQWPLSQYWFTKKVDGECTVRETAIYFDSTSNVFQTSIQV